uniref:Uncharacterized protein n=1 Tax=Anguilla anguilla TaxID=7936 RepID=A0A0E9PIW3_ANGAN
MGREKSHLSLGIPLLCFS